jgi:putative hemolysin
MSEVWPQLILVFVLVLTNAAFAGTEMAMVSLSVAQLHRLERRSAAGARVARLARDPNRYLSTIQIGITLAGFLASASAAIILAEPLVAVLPALGDAARPTAVVLVTVVLSYVTLVVGELVPKRVAMQRAEPWALAAARPLAALSTLARPVVWLLGVSTDVVVRLVGVNPRAPREQVTTEDLRTMVDTQTSMTEQQREVIHGAFEIADRRLRDIMRPRPQVFVLEPDLAAEVALEELVRSGHTRAPVAEARDLDHVSGIVHMRDLVGRSGTPVGDLAAEPVVFPEGARVLPVLSELQRRRVQLAVVLDEHGSAVGLISVEDLVEEIVGEIYDETDRDTLEVIRERDGGLLVPGHFPVHDLVDLDVEDVPTSGAYSTVAGLVLDRLARMPDEPGDVVTVAGHTFEVVEIGRRTIERVRVRVRPGRAGQDGEETDGRAPR